MSCHSQENADLLARPGSSDRPVRMQRKHKVAFVTIVPSPYQRDLFGALTPAEAQQLGTLMAKLKPQGG